MAGRIKLVEQGRGLAFSFEDVLRYHGGGSPGGAAIAFKALECALPLLGAGLPCERREIVIDTAFGGPGARDAFELITRAVTGGRYRIDQQLERPERGRVLERFVFTFGYRGTALTLLLNKGFVTDEFVDLARTEGRDATQESRLDQLKAELAERVMGTPAADLFAI